jgi:hypothetical protein
MAKTFSELNRQARKALVWFQNTPFEKICESALSQADNPPQENAIKEWQSAYLTAIELMENAATKLAEKSPQKNLWKKRIQYIKHCKRITQP